MGEYVEKEMGIAKEKIILVPGGSLPEKIEYKLPEKRVGEPIYLGYIGVDDFEIRGMLPVFKIINKKFNLKDNQLIQDAFNLNTMEGLKKLDEVSYIRFASVYKKFKDIALLQKIFNHSICYRIY